MKHNNIFLSCLAIITINIILIAIYLNSMLTTLNDISKKLDALQPYQFTVVRDVPIYIDRSEEEEIEEVKISISEKYENEIPYLAKTIYGEARGCSEMQQAAVVWCILNRVDSDQFPNDIISVVTESHNGIPQFSGYSDGYPIEENLVKITIDVLERWEEETNGVENVGRVLPKEYLFFYGDGKVNHFTRKSGGTVEWDWSLHNPYEEE